MSETELFRGFEQQYFEVSNAIKTELANAKKQKGTIQFVDITLSLHQQDKRKEILAKVKKSLDRAKDLINQMKIEANSIAKADIKADLQKRVAVRFLKKQIPILFRPI